MESNILWLIAIIIIILIVIIWKRTTPPAGGGGATPTLGFWDWVGRILGITALFVVIWIGYSIFSWLFPATTCTAKKGSPCFLWVPMGPNKTIWSGGVPVDVKFNGKTTFFPLDQKGTTVPPKEFNIGYAEFRVPSDSDVDTIFIQILSN